MPKSRRNKVVKLTACKKNARPKKERLIEEIRNCLTSSAESSELSESERSRYLYLISLQVQRNSPLKALRAILAPGRVFYGKNKVMQLALGTTPETELLENLHKAAGRIVGETALLVTQEGPQAVREKVERFRVADFARGGSIATQTVRLQKNDKSLDSFPSSMEVQFRQLGLPTSLNLGKIVLVGDFTVCEAGKPLSSTQAHLLKLLGIRMATFSAQVSAYWSDGVFTSLGDPLQTVAGQLVGQQLNNSEPTCW